MIVAPAPGTTSATSNTAINRIFIRFMSNLLFDGRAAAWTARRI